MLRPYTAFKVDARSAQYVSVDGVPLLEIFVPAMDNSNFGRGSNMLWRKLSGATITPTSKDIEKVAETDTRSVLSTAGENWRFVL